MDFKLTGITWVGNFYQKFEEVCQEVDDIVGQDAVKYLGNQVQNVGDSVKRFCSDVVQEVLPLPHSFNPVKHEYDSVALNNNNVDSQFKSTAAVEENIKGTEENSVNSVIKSLHNSNAINPANNQDAQTSIEHDLVNQVSDEVSSNSLEGEDSYTVQEEVGDDYPTETSGVINENLLVSVGQFDVKSTPQLSNSLSVNENDPLESSIISEPFSGSYESGCQGVAGTEKNSGSFMSDSLSTKSPGRYCFELNSCKDNSVDVAGHSLDSSLVLVSSVTTPDVGVADQIMTSQDGPVSCSSSQSIESNEGETSTVNEAISLNKLSGQISSAQDRAIVSLSEIGSDESLVNSIESSKEVIHLDDDVNLEESCIFVDDSELHAVSYRTQRLRSYKKRIKDAFTPKKRLEKEYQQLAIWYGDSGMDSSEGTSQTGLPFRSRRRSLEPRNQHLCESEWELL
ncbi:uncharacterized protein G2W53_020794 [Senna tora]|uniref:Uncharacterized protein n=1 Tax=Senna tora TaxID=362788 RepID=A0A834WGL2_9FABA|nr:uncharacterized protein G2W53_020794 [Senna tora]